MNLFTKFLSQRMDNAPLTAFVTHWDEMEQLVIAVFKGKVATAADKKTYHATRTWLLNQYPHWETRLDPLWRQTLVGGQLATADPFLRIISHETADGLIGDWVAMQNLAAAREALNQLVIDSSDSA